MDKIIAILQEELKQMESEYLSKVSATSDWKLTSYLPQEMIDAPKEEKANFLLERYLKNDRLYRLILDDINTLRLINSAHNISQHLRILKVDERDLERHGFNQRVKQRVYQLEKRIRAALLDNR